MTTSQRVILVVALFTVSMLTLTPLILPILFLLGTSVAVGIWRIGNCLEKGFNEHTNAMQTIYDEIAKANRADKPSAS